MIIQNIVLPKKEICGEEELYFRRGIPVIFPEEEGLVFGRGQTIGFDTYMNSFSLRKWVEYTGLRNLSLCLKLKGSFSVTLLQYFPPAKKESAKRGAEKSGCAELGTFTAESESEKDFVFPYITAEKNGLLAFRITSKKENGVLYGGYYQTEPLPFQMRDIKIAIGICTFKREPYVRNNMKNLETAVLENERSPLKDKLEVFISDNAGTLTEEDFGSKKIHLFRNKNTGGSGGFTRTMIEVNRANEAGAGFTHILLMDDDVVFDPESIYRTFAVLSLANEKYKDAFVGGAMFRTDKQYLQHASGEYWHGEQYTSFITSYNSKLDMRKAENVAKNERLTDANYQAWWFCAIPMSVCRTDNLSLPFFIKSDDIEYSIRNLEELILLNGINVWHESFESKYSASNEYYTVRNYLVTSAVHDVGLSVSDIKKYLKKYILHYLSNFKYREAELVCEAMEDFLKGVDYMKSLDLEAKHKEVMKGGYKMLDSDQLPVKGVESLYNKTVEGKDKLSRCAKFFRLLCLNGMILPSHKVIALGIWGGTHYQTYRARKIIRYEPATQKGFVLERSFSKFCHCWRLYRRTNAKLKRKYEKAKNDFRDRYRELIGIEFWQTKI